MATMAPDDNLRDATEISKFARWVGHVATFVVAFKSLVILAVLGSLLISMSMFYVASMDLIHIETTDVRAYIAGLKSVEDHNKTHSNLIAHMVSVFDDFLFAAMMLIFSFGMFELFVDPRSSDRRSTLGIGDSPIRSLDDLKNRLAKLLMLMLVVNFFEQALRASADFEHMNKDALVYSLSYMVALAVGMVLIAGALHLGRQDEAPPEARIIQP